MESSTTPVRSFPEGLSLVHYSGMFTSIVTTTILQVDIYMPMRTYVHMSHADLFHACRALHFGFKDIYYGMLVAGVVRGF